MYTSPLRTLIISTGLSKPFKPEFLGSELMEGYEDISVDPDDFEGQNVFILGKFTYMYVET